MKKLRIWIEPLVIAVVIAVVIRTFIIQAYNISSGSMENTLMTGDKLFVNKLAYVFDDPQPNDIVVFEFPHNPTKEFIKRVIAVPYQTVQIKDKVLYVNGKKVSDPLGVYYADENIELAPSSRDNFGPITVHPDSFFVLGDNRDDSFDSRFWGLVGRDRIIGKTLVRYFSFAPDSSAPSNLFKLIGYNVVHAAERIRWERCFTVPR